MGIYCKDKIPIVAKKMSGMEAAGFHFTLCAQAWKENCELCVYLVNRMYEFTIRPLLVKRPAYRDTEESIFSLEIQDFLCKSYYGY